MATGTLQTPTRGIAWPRAKYVLFGLLAVLYAYVLWIDESFLFNSKDPEWAHIASFRWWLLPHGVLGACALFLGPLQFSDRLRQKYAKVHRVIGRFYVAGVFCAAPLGIYIQWFEERMGESRGFTIATAADAAIWIFSTSMAMFFILRGNVQQHRQWMVRSFSCALIFLEGRAVIGLLNWDKYSEIVVWACVVAAFPLADLALNWNDLRRTRRMPLRVR